HVQPGVQGVERHPGVPVVRGGDTDDIDALDLLLVEDVAIVLRHAVLVVLVDAAALGRRIQAAALALAQLEVAVPHVAAGDRLDLDAALLHFQDHVDVLLAAAADAEEGNADALVGAVNATGAGGSEGKGAGSGASGFQEVSTVDVVWHRRASRTGRMAKA